MRQSKYSGAYRALLAQRAAGLRSSLTRSEQALWGLIRGKQLGVWFRRQVVLGRFIADLPPSVRASSWRRRNSTRPQPPRASQFRDGRLIRRAHSVSLGVRDCF
jgi:hypothetical protein